MGERGKDMELCNIYDCGEKHYKIAYCKIHYDNFKKYGNPFQTEVAVQMTARNTVKWAMSTDGECNVDGCEKPRKARGLCEAHYARQRRYGSTDLKNPGGKLNKKIDTCLVIECGNEHYQNGYCATHSRNNRELKTPYRPKIIKLCGVQSCEKVHLARGLCRRHYYQWTLIQNEYGITWRHEVED